MNLQIAFKIIQAVLSGLLIVTILLQSKGVGLSSVFTAGSWVYRSKRGLEKALFMLTILLAVLFIISSFINFYIYR